MKRILLTGIIGIGILLSHGQENPVKRYAYWYDDNYTNGVMVDLASPETVVVVEDALSVESVTEGLHTFSIRFQDENNNWSPPVSSQFVKRIADTRSHQLLTFQYWIDTDYEQVITTSVAPAATCNLADLIDVSTLKEGLHTISFRIKDESGIWSSVATKQFVKRISDTQPHQLKKIQYWFDTDFANVVNQTVPATGLLNVEQQIDVSSLAEGLHVVSFRMADESGIWSSVATKQFVKRIADTKPHQLKRIQYWFDSDFSQPVTEEVTSASLINIEKEIDINALAEGLHVVSFRTMDESGIWSPAQSSQFVKRSADTKPHLLNQYQYWFDDQAGSAVTEEFSAMANLTADQMIDINPLESGLHTVSFRTRDESGIWSSVATKQIIKRETLLPLSDIMAYRYWFNDQQETMKLVELASPAPVTAVVANLDATVIPPATDQWVSFQFLDGNGKWSSAVTDTFSRNAVTKASFDADLTQGCSPLTVNFNNLSVDADSYIWYFGDGTTSTESEPQHIYAAPGSYDVALVAKYSSTSVQDSIQLSSFITVFDDPVVDLGPDVSICDGSSVTLSVTSGYASYKWNGSVGSNSLNVSSAGTYVVEVENANGCVKTDTVVVTVLEKPSINLGADLEICQGESAVITAPSGFSSYKWNGTTGSNELTVSTAGTYILEVTNANNCSAKDTVKVVVNDLPIVNLGPDREICQGSSVTLTAPTGYASYKWNGVAGTNTKEVTIGGTYTVEVENASGCKATDQVVVTVVDLPVVNLGPDQEICQGSSVTLTAPTGYASYKWNGVAGTNTKEVTTGGTYTVEVENAGGCKATDQVVVTVIDLPVVNLGADREICQGSSVTLTAPTGYASYKWNGVAGTNTKEVTTGGTYTVEVENAGGCKATDQVVVTVVALPVVDLGPDREICQGSSVTLTAPTGYASYKWNGVAGTNTKEVTSGGTYTVEVENAGGCKATDQVVVTVVDLPVVNLGPDQEICQGSSVTLTAPAGYAGYKWNGVAGTNTKEVTIDGTYTVEIENAGGCKATDQVVVTVVDLPVVNLGPDREICQGSSVALTAPTGYVSYKWNGVAGTNTKEVTTGGTYTVEVENAGGCKTTDQVVVTVVALPVVDLGPDREICQGSPVTLTAPTGYASYKWNGVAGANTKEVTVGGTYTVEVETAGGCKATDQVTVTVVDLPVVNLGPDQEICQGSSVTLTAPAGYAGYKWNGVAGTNTKEVTTSGTYTVEVENANGCKATDQVIVTVISVATINLGPDLALCEGETTTLIAPSGYASYSWNGVSGSAQLQVGSSGIYHLQVVDSHGCSGEGQIEVSIESIPQKPSITVGSNLLTSSFTGINRWFLNGLEISRSTAPTLQITESGTYTVMAESGNGCQSVLSDPVEAEFVQDDFLTPVAYPNPTRDLVTVKYRKEGYRLELYTANGELLTTRIIDNAEAVIDLSGQSAGVYIFRLIHNGKDIRQIKVIKF